MDTRWRSPISKPMPKIRGRPNQNRLHGGFGRWLISAWIAYQKNWKWPAYAKHKPKKLNIVGWFGNSPFLPPDLSKEVGAGDPPGFVMYGGKESIPPLRPPRARHTGRPQENKVWSKMIYADFMGHAPAKRILFNPQSRDKETHSAYLEFLDMVCHEKASQRGRRHKRKPADKK